MEPALVALPNELLAPLRTNNFRRVLSSPPNAILAAVVLVGLIGWFDYHTGDFALTVFYFAPIALATWYAGRFAGWSIAFFSGTSWLVSELAQHETQPAFLPYYNAGMLVLVCGTVAELILSRRRAQDRLRARLELRTVSLAEVHHRVKNNLQIVSSLLLLQSDKFADPEVRGVFAECRNRINAMARLHEQLYRDVELSELDFATHLRELAQTLVRSHTPPACELTLDLRADRVPLDLDRGILLSLIANELLLNPLKHAFAGRADGKLEVELRWSARRVVLSIRDNGRGIAPEVIANADHGSSGLALVRAMSRQLDGELTIGRDPAGGTRASISFPTKAARQPRDFSVSTTSLHHVEETNPDRRRRSPDRLCA